MAYPFSLPVGLTNSFDDEETFYAVIDRLKALNALPSHSFEKDLPFFNIPCLPKETQMRELFEHACDAELCKYLLQNIIPLAEGAEYKMIPQNFSPLSVMSFAQIILYKVLPCPEANCPNCPREIATHNQYHDYEYECPFYHHERDRRRLVITEKEDEEFVYKANYLQENRGRRVGDKDKHSQNYFESMFHPLYYKMFKCKRNFCDHSAYCPFFHTEEEKNAWDESFKAFLTKDRVSYIKDKQTSSDKKPRGQRKGSDDGEACVQDNRNPQQRKNFKPSYQQQNYPMYFEDASKMSFEKKSNALKMELISYKQDSHDSSFEEKYGHGFFSKLQEVNQIKYY